MKEIIATIKDTADFLRLAGESKHADGLYALAKEYNAMSIRLEAVIVNLQDLQFTELHKVLNRCLKRLDDMDL